MTVYAIVNGISDHMLREANDFPVWTLLSPAAILQGGNPYFVPDFSERFEARCALAFKIGRLGKGIAARFAHRYVEGVAPAILFVAVPLLERLSHDGLPWTRAISYDKCLALGRFIPHTPEATPECRVGLKISSANEDDSHDLEFAFDSLDIASIIERLSRDNTLKTGDIIIAGLRPQGPRAAIGQSVILSLNGNEPLRFNIR